MRCLARGFLPTVVVCLIAATPASAAVFQVDSAADAVDAAPGDGVCASAADGCTLRAAVQEANALAGADRIDVPAGTYRLSLAGPNEEADVTGDLDVTSDVTLVGASARTVTITARPDDPTRGGSDRVVDVLPGGRLAASRVAISDGVGDSGANIRAAGPLDLTDVAVSGGDATNEGGGIDASGPVSLDRVTIAQNRASSGDGGGVATRGSLSAVNSTLFGNAAQGDGGGIAVLSGSADLVNVTLAQNGAYGNPPNTAVGGQIYNQGATTLRNSVLEHGFPLGNPITGVDDGPAPNCGGVGAITSGGYNVVDDGSCGLSGPGDRITARLSYVETPLAAGGETDVLMPFHAPYAEASLGDTPTVDTGAPSCPATDQRGVARPQGASCDAGAYEAEIADLYLTVGPVPKQVAPGTFVTFTVTVGNNGTAAADAVLRFVSSTRWELFRDGLGCPQDRSCIGHLAPGQSVTVEFRGTAPERGAVSAAFAADNAAPAESYALDLDPSNDSGVSITIPVVPPAPATTPAGAVLRHGRCANPLRGGAAADVLTGSAAGDRIRGMAGNDTLRGLAGDDCLDGGAGNDRLTGGAGHDVLKGGPGNDFLNAADGQRDIVDCGSGRDRARVDRMDKVRGCERVIR